MGRHTGIHWIGESQKSTFVFLSYCKSKGCHVKYSCDPIIHNTRFSQSEKKQSLYDILCLNLTQSGHLTSTENYMINSNI